MTKIQVFNGGSRKVGGGVKSKPVFQVARPITPNIPSVDLNYRAMLISKGFIIPVK